MELAEAPSPCGGGTVGLMFFLCMAASPGSACAAAVGATAAARRWLSDWGRDVDLAVSNCEGRCSRRGASGLVDRWTRGALRRSVI